MLLLLGIVCGLVCVIGLSQVMQKWDRSWRNITNRKKRANGGIVFHIISQLSNRMVATDSEKVSRWCSRGHMHKDLSEQELLFITRILSIGLVDADPDILHHIKQYQDLCGIST